MFLEAWNGIIMIHKPADRTPDVHLYSNASESLECEAWSGRQWFQLQLPNTVSNWSISTRSGTNNFGKGSLTYEQYNKL